MRKLRVGLLLDSYRISAWFYRAIKHLSESECCEIVLLVMKQGHDITFLQKFKQERHHLLYFIFERMDRFLWQQKENAFAKKDLRTLLARVPVVQVKCRETAFCDYILTDHIAEIRQYDLDILIRGGFRILKGEILKTANYGVWSYHHGDNRKNRGRPAGFWETLEQWHEVGTIFQVLNEELDGGTVLHRSWAPVHPFSPYLTSNAYFWTSSFTLRQIVERLFRLGEVNFYRYAAKVNRPFEFYSKELKLLPTNLQMIPFFFHYLARIVKFFVEKNLYENSSCLFYHFSSTIQTSLRKFKILYSPAGSKWEHPNILRIKGNPFLVLDVSDDESKQSQISVAPIGPDGLLAPLKPVFGEFENHCKPHVFTWKNVSYLAVYNKVTRSIDLYRCNADPHQWEFCSHLFKNVDVSKYTIFYCNDRWWLQMSLNQPLGGDDTVQLFMYSRPRLFSGKWHDHVLNPIYSDSKMATPAGWAFRHNDKLFRPSNDVTRKGKHRINIGEVINISEKTYEERLVGTITPEWHNGLTAVTDLIISHGITLVLGKTKHARWQRFSN